MGVRAVPVVLVSLLVLTSVGACSANPTTPAQTLAPGLNGASQAPVGSAGVTLPGTNPACQQMQEPILELGQVEAGLRGGSMTDAAAAGAVIGIQQVLVAVADQAGQQSPIGQAIHGLVGALGDLEVLLNRSGGIDVLNPQLQKVDAALVALANACAAG